MTHFSHKNQEINNHRIDLHCHSTYSDGLLSPREIIEQAIHAQVQTLALTDHDTIAGLSELHEAAQHSNIRIIDGIELSAAWKKHAVHILGLNINPSHNGLKQLLSKQLDNRKIRAKQISDKFAQIGINNMWEKCYELAQHERIGRPHFARVLVNQGVCLDIRTAFRKYLIQGRPAYVASTWLPLEDVVTTIIACGGIAVIAHPLKYSFTRTKLKEFIISFKQAGGTSLEVISGEMTNESILEATKLCAQFELTASTGSDYHGPGVSRIKLGHQAILPTLCPPIWLQF